MDLQKLQQGKSSHMSLSHSYSEQILQDLSIGASDQSLSKHSLSINFFFFIYSYSVTWAFELFKSIEPISNFAKIPTDYDIKARNSSTL